MLPTLGRIVIYRFRDGTVAPAMVTAIAGDLVALTVFPAAHVPFPVVDVVHDESPAAPAGTWSWPPRAEGGPREIGLAGT